MKDKIQLLEQLQIEMENQNVPKDWQDIVLAGFNREPEKIPQMLKWLIEHRDIDYESLDLIKQKLKLVGSYKFKNGKD